MNENVIVQEDMTDACSEDLIVSCIHEVCQPLQKSSSSQMEVVACLLSTRVGSEPMGCLLWLVSEICCSMRASKVTSIWGLQ